MKKTEKKTSEKEIKSVESITWDEAVARNIFYNALPLSKGDRSIDGKTLASLILLQVDYSRAAAEYESRMQDALAKLKEQMCPDYDAEAMKKAEERREGFAEDETALVEAYTRMRGEEAMKPCGRELRAISAEEFAAVCSLGADGEVTLGNPQKTKAPLSDVLRMVAMTIG